MLASFEAKELSDAKEKDDLNPMKIIEDLIQIYAKEGCNKMIIHPDDFVYKFIENSEEIESPNGKITNKNRYRDILVKKQYTLIKRESGNIEIGWQFAHSSKEGYEVGF